MRIISPSDQRDSASAFGMGDYFSWDESHPTPQYTANQIPQSFALMAQAGVGMVRFEFLWKDIEPSPGRYVFSKYDRLVDEALAHGIKVLGILIYNPDYAAVPWSQAPEALSYGEYACAVVHHFRDRVRHWQIWHEPDNPAFWQPQDHMRGYTSLLKHVTPSMKEIDPTCVVHLGGLSHSMPGSLNRIYDQGGKDYFDVIAIHPFANPLVPGALEALQFFHQNVRRLQAEYGDEDKPIWLTEIGCPGMRDPLAAPHWWLGKNPDEAAQAEWIRTVYATLPQWPGIEKIFWVYFRDTDNHFKTGSDFEGLIRRDFSPKPAFQAYRDLAQRT